MRSGDSIQRKLNLGDAILAQTAQCSSNRKPRLVVSGDKQYVARPTDITSHTRIHFIFRSHMKF
jgi:hypothetical protein